MKKSEAIFGVARVPLDALAVVAALLLSFRLREASIDLLPWQHLLEPANTLPPLGYYLSTFVVPSVLTFLFLATVIGLYTLQATRSAWEEVGRVLVVTALWLVIVIAWYFLVMKELFFSRALLLYAAFFMTMFALLGRMALTLLQRSMLRAGIGRRAVVSIGDRNLAAVGRVTLEHDERYWYLGHLSDLAALKRMLYQRPIDLVLHTDPNPSSDDTLALIGYCRSHHLGYGFLPPVLADVPHQLRVEKLGLLPLVRFQPTPLDGWGRVAKRLFDIIGSILLMAVLMPFLLLISLLVLLEGGLPILYISERVGEQGRKRVRLLKFRSMVPDADRRKSTLARLNHRRDGPLFKVRNDPRVTRIGRVLRRWSLDELPQLWNVLLGHLSLVGPRPHLPDEVARYSLEQRRVFAVKPGLTGLAQVSGRSDLSFDDEVRSDLRYIEEWSMLLDLWILWRTLFTVLSRKGAD